MDNVKHLKSGIVEALSAMVDNVDDFGLLLVGSLAHGLFTDRSDIDVVAIDYSGKDYGIAMRRLTHVGNRRCEIFVASPKDLASLHASVTGDGLGTGSLSMATLNYDLFINVAFGIPLTRTDDVLDSVRAFTRERASELACNFDIAKRNFRRWESEILEWLGLEDLAAGAARSAVAHHIMFLINKVGRFPCLSDKRLELLLDRSGLGDNHVQELVALWKAKPETIDDSYLPRVQRALGGPCLDNGSARAIMDETRFYPLLEGAIVNRDQVSILVKPGHEEQVEQFMSRPNVLLCDIPDDMRPLVKILFENGAASFEQGPLALKKTGILCRGTKREIDIGYAGHAWRSEWSSNVALIEITHQEIVAMVEVIILNGVLYANLKEDVVGAIHARSWPQIDSCFRRMVSQICTAFIASKRLGLVFLNSVEEYWLLEILKRSGEHSHFLSLAINALNMQVSDRQSAINAFDQLQKLQDCLAPSVWGDIVNCMESGETHNRIIVGLLSAWAEIKLQSASSGADVASHRRKWMDRSDKIGEQQKHASFAWERTDDIKRELELCAD